jgi:hypothetical protein
VGGVEASDGGDRLDGPFCRGRGDLQAGSTPGSERTGLTLPAACRVDQRLLGFGLHGSGRATLNPAVILTEIAWGADCGTRFTVGRAYQADAGHPTGS